MSTRNFRFHRSGLRLVILMSLTAAANLGIAIPAHAERASQDMMSLHRAPFQLEVTVLSVESKPSWSP